MKRHTILAFSLALLAACQSRPPVEVSRSLVASPELASRQPVDVVVLPIEDATSGHVLRNFTTQLRDDIAHALGRRLYSPLAVGHVDARITAQQASQGSAVDAGFVKGLTGRCGEDAVLGVRVTRWDERTMMDDGRVTFGADVLMLGADGAVLWSGRLDGSVKAGGEGPAPLARDARTRSAVSVFGRALIDELPKRR